MAVDKPRVFVSYSHKDRSLAEELVAALEGAGADPLWDEDIPPGSEFSEKIQAFLAHSHLFVPLLTHSSASRPWVHQEIGYAVALGIPVMPVTANVLPKGLVATLQATRFEDLGEKLSEGALHRLVESAERRPAQFECPEDNTRRAGRLADHADRVHQLGRTGKVRQKASLTTFHLPDRGPRDRTWNRYFAARPDDELLFENLRRERLSLTRHARASGCRLILDPLKVLPDVYREHGPDSVLLRAQGLLDFLCSEEVPDVEVVFGSDEKRLESLTIVGDWFSSEAVSSAQSRILREAVFTRHGPTVRRQIKDFNLEFNHAVDANKWTVGESRERVIRELAKFIEALTSDLPEAPVRSD